MPLELASDRGPKFRSELMDLLCERLRIKHRYASPYYPQCNGMNERFNPECIEIIGTVMRSHDKD